MIRFYPLVRMLIVLVLLNTQAISRVNTTLHNIEITQGPASETLVELQNITGVDIIYRPRILTGIQTNAIQGRMTAEEAVRAMVSGTGLEVVQDSDSGAIAIIQPPPQPLDAPAAKNRETTEETQSNTNMNKPITNFFRTVLSTIIPLTTAVSNAQEEENILLLSPFEVSTSGDINDYIASESITGTRVATFIQDLPFAVNVVTVEFINDFNAEDLADQFAYVSAFAPDGSQEGAYQLRGFRQTNQLRNGFTRIGLVSRTNMDRAEVIKGPNAAIYGRTDPGGIINIVTKRPTTEQTGRVDLSVGTNDYYRAQFSSSGPIGANKNLLYRFDASFLDFEHGIAFMGREEQTYSGVLEYRYGENSRLVFEAEYLSRDQNRGRRLLFNFEDNSGAPDRYLEIAYDLFDKSFVGPNEFNDRDIKTYNLTWEHQINENVSFRAAGNLFDRGYNQWTTFPSRVVVQGSNAGVQGTMPFLEPVFKDIAEAGEAIQADLLTQFETGDIRHKLLITFDYQREEKVDLDYRYNRRLTGDQRAELSSRIGEPITSGDLRRVPALNVRNVSIENPDFSGLDLDHIPIVTDVTRYGSAIGGGTIGTGRLNRDNYDDIEVMGIFISERMELQDGKLLLFGNMRYDEVTSTLEAASVSTSNRYSQSVTEFSVDDITYALGVNYEIADKVRVYANYATSFQRQTEFNDRDRNTGDQLAEPEFFDNETGKGWEVGIKTSINDKLFSTITYFDISKENVVIPETFFIPDPDNPGEEQQITVNTANGEEKSSGFEVDMNYLVTPSFQITGAYGYVDAEIVRASAPILEGLPPAQTPEHNLGIMTRFRPVDGNLKGWEFALGYRYASESRPTNDGGRQLFYQDAYGIVEGFVGYRFKMNKMNHRVSLNFKNLTDEQFTVGNLSRGEPRRFILKWTTSF